MSVIEHFQDRYDAVAQEEFSLDEYLNLCREDPSVYATAAERLLLGSLNSWIRQKTHDCPGYFPTK